MSLFRTFCSVLVFIVSAQFLVYTAKQTLRTSHGPVFSPAFLRRPADGTAEGAAPAAAAAAAPPHPGAPAVVAAHGSGADSWLGVAPLQGAPLAPAAALQAAPALQAPMAPLPLKRALIPNVQLPPRQGGARAADAPTPEQPEPVLIGPAPQRHVARDFFCENRAPQGSKGIDASSMAAFIASGGRFPIALLTCNRAQQLERTLKDLLAVRCVLPSDVTVIADTCSGAEALADIARAAGVAYHLHARNLPYPGEDGAARIAAHYGYALGHMLNGAAAAPGLVVVEDDMAFAPDFYEFFHAVAGLVEGDASTWLASAWHDNGFDYLVADPLALRRTRYFPGLGWLLPRALWQGQLASGWPASHWDHWMRDPAQHRGRDIVYPELPRDYHMGVQGTFMDSGTHNRYFGSIALASDAAFTWDTPEGAASIEATALEAYEDALEAAVGDAEAVHLDSPSAIAAFTSGVGIVWYTCACGDPDHASMRPLAAYFGVWHEGARGSREGVHELWWLGTARLYLINVAQESGQAAMNGVVEGAPPWLRALMPPGHTPLQPSAFVGAARPVLPQHKAIFGAQWRTPLAHLEGGHDGNGGEDGGGGCRWLQ